MVSDPLNFKNSPAKFSPQTAKSRKDFAKKNFKQTAESGDFRAFSEMVAKLARLGRAISLKGRLLDADAIAVLLATPLFACILGVRDHCLRP
jgi:hypothetical protein